jgi:hypothetical protein
MAAYEDCLQETSTKNAPWYAVPADDKKTARLIVSKVILETLKGMKMKFPELSEAQRTEMAGLREQLAKE